MDSDFIPFLSGCPKQIIDFIMVSLQTLYTNHLTFPKSDVVTCQNSVIVAIRSRLKLQHEHKSQLRLGCQ